MNFGNTEVELLEYRYPRGREYVRKNYDVGATHVCFEAPDIQAAYEQLQAKGVEFYAPPLKISIGPLTGYTFVSFKDPDGITLEFFELPR